MKIKTKNFEIEFTKEELKDKDFMKKVNKEIIGERKTFMDTLRLFIRAGKLK